MERGSDSEYQGIGLENTIFYWKKKICDYLFLFFSIFGFIAYIPSVILSIKSDVWSLVIINTITYIAVIFVTIKKKIPFNIRAIFGSSIFYLIGLLLLIILGPMGAGNLWLFAFTLIAGLILGEKGAIIALILNILTQVTIFILMLFDLLNWKLLPDYDAFTWLITCLNFTLLNTIIVFSNTLLTRGFYKLLKRTTETKKATILGLAKLAEHRDSCTGSHLIRIQAYTTVIAESLSRSDKYRKYITREYIEDIQISSILHDIGKVGINDAILLKSGSLTKKEFEKIMLHPAIGADVIVEIEKNIKGRSFYDLGREIVYSHHEKWDGTGYPEGLAGDQIPLSARIVALADVYDALTKERPYKKAIPHETAIQIITEGKGTHFDPEIVETFLNNEKMFYMISVENDIDD